MMTDSLKRVQAIFDEALAKAPEDRAAFVAAACDDAAVRARVESLLAHHEQADDAFMRVPKANPRFSLRGIADGPDPRVGTTIGGYHIESVIASGGMGTVYLARQRRPDRHVAMKVMHVGMSSRSALRRFEYESQILAKLQHPNIAQVYEAGTHSTVRDREEQGSSERDQDRGGAVSGSDDRLEDGPARFLGGRLGDGPARSVPYFVMEYVPGARSITAYAAQETLSTRDRLTLFTQVCEAVQHGHQKGIIHRDLKPGNILVDSSGQVKVIDFGVARSTDSDVAVTTMKTDVGQLIGTMQYMSPEQCAADPDDLDMRSDVYALGVVLYELLFEQPPYDVSGMTIVSAARMICETLPTPPRSITKRGAGGRSAGVCGTGVCGTGVSPVKRDVESIVLKALKKDRQERYLSAAELAADIRRYLRGEPTEARPPTAWTRVLRWAARRPIAATVTTCVVIAVGIIGGTWLANWYTNKRPHEVVLLKRPGRELAQDGYEAKLLSLNGRVLQEWTCKDESGIGSGIGLAQLVERPAEFGGGRLVVLGFGHLYSGPLRRSLCAFDPAVDLDVPVWQRRVETDEILPTLRTDRSFTAEEFGVQYGWVFDVFPEDSFPECPGEEIVVSYVREPSSQHVLRIYDLTGKLLYQIWHDGALGSCHWMADARLLVFAGGDATLYWENGEMRCARQDPLIVFAIRPEIEHIADGYLRDLPQPDDPTLVWYRYLYKDEESLGMYGEWKMTLSPTFTRHDPGRFVEVAMEHANERRDGAGFSWVIDEFGNEPTCTDGDGNETPCPRFKNDIYSLNRETYPEGDPRRLPDPNSFKLSNRPPIITFSPSSPKTPMADPAEP